MSGHVTALLYIRGPQALASPKSITIERCTVAVNISLVIGLVSRVADFVKRQFHNNKRFSVLENQSKDFVTDDAITPRIAELRGEIANSLVIIRKLETQFEQFEKQVKSIEEMTSRCAVRVEQMADGPIAEISALGANIKNIHEQIERLHKWQDRVAAEMGTK